ncbi:MAG: hypothetical protein PHI35_07800, partial [Victivallaceae bacterium]|nr:hypothetical protein [Victivallaceae bacterium]
MAELIIGGSETGITLPDDYQPVTVISGGTLTDGTVNADGTLTVNGGKLVNAIVNDGGLITMNGGVIDGMEIKAQTATTPYDLVINSGTANNVSGNVKTQILVAGKDAVISGGTITGTPNVGWTRVDVNSGGVIYNLNAQMGGVIFTLNTGAKSYNTVLAGVNYNATNNGVCGNEFINGGIASGTICNDHGVQTVSNGGQAYDTKILGNYGTLKSFQSVGYKGTAYRTVIGRADNMQMGGQQIVTGTSAYAYMTSIVGSGLQMVSGGGQVFDTSLGEYGVQTLGENGIAYNTLVGVAGGTAGGRQDILNGGVASNTTILANGSQVVNSGAQALDNDLANGGYIKVEDGGKATIQYTPWQTTGTVDSATGATVTYLGRDANVYCGNADSGINAKGNTVSGTVVNDNDQMTIFSGGTVVDTTLTGAGSIVISGNAIFGGTANNIAAGKITDINGVVLDGVSVIDNKMTLDGAISENTFTVMSGLVLTGASTFNATNVTLIAGNGGTISGVNASFRPATGQNATIFINYGGTSIDNTLGVYRQETVNAGGKSYNMTINGLGAAQWIQGTTYNTKIVNGAQYINASAGAASGTTIYNGGITAYNNGSVYDAKLMQNTASLVINRGATAYNTIVSGGTIQVGRVGDAAGGNLAGVTTLYNGGFINGLLLGTMESFDLVTDSTATFSDTAINATGTITINGNALSDNKYFSGQTAYVLSNTDALTVTVGAAADNYSKLTGKDAELTAIATDDGKTTYAGTLDATYTDT